MLPDLGNFGGLMGLFMFFFATMGLHLFGVRNPEICSGGLDTCVVPDGYEGDPEGLLESDGEVARVNFHPPAAAATPDEPVRAGPMFGELIPSGDPQWYQGFRSPHYKQTHYDFRDKVRAFVEQVIDPHVEEWEEYAYFPKGEGPDPEKQVPDMELLKQAAEWGLCLLYTSPSPRDKRQSRMPSSA